MEENLDKKHLNTMLYLVSHYKDNPTSLRRLINDLDALIGLLESLDEKQRNKLQTLCGHLEDTYAIMLSKNENELNEKQKLYISAELEKIKTFITEISSSL